MIALEKKNLLRAVDFENHFIPVIAYIEYCGAKIDVNKWRIKMKKDIESMHVAEAKINKWVEDYYNQHKIEHPSPEYKGKPFVQATMKTTLKRETKDLMNIPASAFGVRRIITDEGVEYKYGIPFDYVKQNLQGDLFSGFECA